MRDFEGKERNRPDLDGERLRVGIVYKFAILLHKNLESFDGAVRSFPLCVFLARVEPVRER
eukprot:334135-Amorphochlora_amoeboformis.AAC.1